MKSLCEGIAVHCPGAVVNIISNPVNSSAPSLLSATAFAGAGCARPALTRPLPPAAPPRRRPAVPIAAEVFKKAGTFDAAKLFGVTTLDVVRANTFVSASKGTDLASTAVPVVGGHAGITILPLLSQAEPAGLVFGDAEREALTVRIQNAGTEVVDAKAGAGSATLSMAYAAARFAESCLRGLAGEEGVVECAFVASSVEPSLAFFASKVRLGPKGAAEVYPVGPMTEYERGWYDKLVPELKASIDKGVAFVANPPPPPPPKPAA